MHRPSNAGSTLGRAFILFAGLIGAATAAMAQGTPTHVPPAKPASPERPGSLSVDAEAAALRDFSARLDRYLDMRARLVRTLKPLSSASGGTELAARQEALAAAIIAARAGARRGDLIPTLVAQRITAIVRDDFSRRTPAAKVGLAEHVPAQTGAALVNTVYPASEPLSPMPPLLLAKLPKLPDNLQYRFAARDVVIIDADVEVVADYIAGVLPPSQGLKP